MGEFILYKLDANNGINNKCRVRNFHCGKSLLWHVYNFFACGECRDVKKYYY
jgi:hypothetical protein